jgi:hypothetical protein
MSLIPTSTSPTLTALLDPTTTPPGHTRERLENTTMIPEIRSRRSAQNDMVQAT